MKATIKQISDNSAGNLDTVLDVERTLQGWTLAEDNTMNSLRFARTFAELKGAPKGCVVRTYGFSGSIGKELLKGDLDCEIFELVRSDSGFWSRDLHAPSLPLGALSSPKAVARLQEITVFDCTGTTWARAGKPQYNNWLVKFVFSGKPKGGNSFTTRTQKVAPRRARRNRNA